MSDVMTNTASDDTLIRDSQISGLSAFKERLGLCCCRLFKKSNTYNVSSLSKDNEETQDKPSYVNQAFQREKQARKDKLDKIAKTLPPPTPNGISKVTTRPLTTVTQGTPRSTLGLNQPKSTVNTPNSKIGISTVNRPTTVLNRNIKNNNNKPEETSTDETSDDDDDDEDQEENSSSDDSDRKAPKKNIPNKRR
ncbi:unnamed protein product [Adineta ricciae]|uniref:Uncharacterized protein n=1 Tax=Adineta ricciae TaxID=249248 RepID=A0A815F259_ADIRI|nr:unnamed protein product [Adineta ricciae]CAF1507106.1 unnamed protein product [Adineta ricciae]